jgi:4'-phosphopantetheinyl transferase
MPSRFSDLDVVFIDLNASRQLLEDEEAGTPRLSTSDKLRIDRLSGDPGRQSLWRAGRIATRIVLERAAGPQVRGVDFEITSGGRPGLGEGFPYFTISHTGDVALVAMCRRSPVGVDIERHRLLSMTEERRRRVIAAAAGFSLDETSDPRNDADVLRAWVRLEAVAKARGSGIGVVLTEAGVIGPAEPPTRVMASSMSVADLDVGAEYIAAIAAEAVPEAIAVTRFPSRSDDLTKVLSEDRV